MFLTKFVRDVRRTQTMYKFFEQARNNGKQPLKVIKFWELYKAVRTR